MFDSGVHKQATAQDVADILRDVRQSKGHSVLDVSVALGIPIPIIEEVEAGDIEEHIKEVYALLCLYDVSTYSVFRGYFERSNLEPLKDSDDLTGHVFDCIRFHKKLHGKPLHLGVLPKARGEMISDSIKSSAGSPSYRRRSKATSSAVLEFRAQDIIQKHGLFQLPINVYQIAKNLGVNIIFESFPSNLYMKLKAFCYKEENFSLIGINKKHKTQLQRYSLAHELHHLLYDFNSNQFACGPSNQHEIIEIDAERFAAELLMPRKMIERLISNPLNLSYLSVGLVAQHFGVSYEAAAIRLEKFGLIGKSKEVCSASYRKKDKHKTNFLLEHKKKYLRAVFGLETGILKLREELKEASFHSICGAPIVDKSHTVCWHCGLEIHSSTVNNIYIENPYRQKLSNLNSEKVISLSGAKEDKSNQLSLNLDVR
ncbi:MAG: ImmA/IrrE family metallo-endopeptidase [Cyanobacteria bacterium P01_D01_bin.56]